MLRTLLAVALVCVAGCAPTTRRATIDDLRTSIQRVRRHEIDATQNLPEVYALVGAHPQELSASLGTPRVCALPLEPPCTATGEILWRFYRPGAERRGRPLLVVRVGADGRVNAAQWRDEAEAALPSTPSE